MDLSRIMKAVETLAHVGQAARRFSEGLGGGSGPDRQAADTDEFGEPQRGSRAGAAAADTLAAGNRVFGQLEARLAGVLVSALKEAFDRDRAHLEMEREQIEHERKRAEELMRLEMLRQAGERELQSIRSGMIITLVVWITSVVFLMIHGTRVGGLGALLVGLGWGLLISALATSFVAYRKVSTALVRGAHEPAAWNALSGQKLAPAVQLLIVLGLGCTAASLLVALI